MDDAPARLTVERFGKIPAVRCSFQGVAASLLAFTVATGATGLDASDGVEDDDFSNSVSISQGNGLVAARSAKIGANLDQGCVYAFLDLSKATGVVTETVKLISSDGASGDHFGSSVSQYGRTALIGAISDDVTYSGQGSAYLFRDLSQGSPSPTETAKLVASDGKSSDRFGSEVWLESDRCLITATGNSVASPIGGRNQGSAYLFRNLNGAAGLVTQSAKLAASDGVQGDLFGATAGMSGSMGLIGAYNDQIGSDVLRGSAYLFRNLDTVTGTKFQNAKLLASDGKVGDLFGLGLSISGNMGLIGAWRHDVGANEDQGQAYLFRNLDAATGNVTETVKLVASDGAPFDCLGRSVSLSGTDGVACAYYRNVGGKIGQGEVYLFRNLDTAVGITTETLKFTASDGVSGERLGESICLEGDRFIVGTLDIDLPVSAHSRAYSGSVSAMTTLDEGDATRATDGISFESRADWIIGKTTDSNHVVLSQGDHAGVLSEGKAVYVGCSAGSDENTLIVAGDITADDVIVGNAAGNGGNTFELESTATFRIGVIHLAGGNYFVVPGDKTISGDLFAYLGETELQIRNSPDGEWLQISPDTSGLIESSFANGRTTILVNGTGVPPIPRIARSAGVLELQWRVAGSDGWILEGSETLGSWSPSNAVPSASGNRWSVNVSSSGAGFFRLSKP